MRRGWFDRYGGVIFGIVVAIAFLGVVFAVILGPDPSAKPLPPGYRFTEAPASRSGNGVEEWCSGPNRVYREIYDGDIGISPNDSQCGPGGG